jgi:spoIIIJ-associated protein
MEWVEVTAKTVAEAKDRALDKLQVDEADAEFEVLEEPRVGLFGRTKGQARVRARVRPAAPRAKVEPRDRRRRGGKDKADKTDKADKADSGDKASKSDSSEAAAPRSAGRSGEPRRRGAGRSAEPAAAAASRPAPAAADAAPTAAAGAEAGGGGRRRPPRRVPGAANGTGAATPLADDASPAEATIERPAKATSAVSVMPADAGDDLVDDRSTDEAETSSGPAKPKRRRSRGGRGGRGGAENQTGSDREDGSGGESEDAMAEGTGRGDHEPVGVDVAARATAGFVEGLVGAFGYQATFATAEIDDETAEIGVDGESLGLLIGPKGRTLQAINEVARIAMLRAEPGASGVRVHVDVSSYRQRRREALTRFAEQVAADVVSNGEARALEPMSAADRKVVHDAMNEVAGVRTTSEGEEPYRRVVIHPTSGE